MRMLLSRTLVAFLLSVTWVVSDKVAAEGFREPTAGVPGDCARPGALAEVAPAGSSHRWVAGPAGEVGPDFVIPVQALGRPSPQVTVEGLETTKDSLTYRVRRGTQTRLLTLQQTPLRQVVVVTGEDQRVRAVALRVNIPTRVGASTVVVTEFRTGQEPAGDPFARAILDADFIAGLRVPPQPGVGTFKQRFAFARPSRVAPKSLLVATLPGLHRPGTQAMSISEFFCTAGCLDSLCAACRRAMCNFLRCIEENPDPEGECRDEAEVVLLHCGGYGG